MIKNIITICVLIGVIATLLFLSHWQVERLTWKTDIVNRLNIEYQKDPDKHQYDFNDLTALKEEKLPIRYGQVSGKFIYDKEILVGPKPYKGAVGYLIITPLRLNDGGHVLVNRGWIKEDIKNSIKEKRPNKAMRINGVIRKTDWNSFTPDNSPQNNVWTKLDIEQIAQEKGVTSIAPVMVYASEINHDFSPVKLQDAKWYPRNKHKQYAIFWAVMSLALIMVSGLYFLKNRKA